MNDASIVLAKVAASAVVLLTLVVASDAMAEAQRRNQPAVKPRPLEKPLTGKLHSLVPAKNLLRMVSSDNQPWIVELKKTTKVKVQGSGGPEILRPGIAVRFYAKLSSRGETVEPIRKIHIVTPDEHFQPGVTEEPGKDDAPASEDLPAENSGDDDNGIEGKEDSDADTLDKDDTVSDLGDRARKPNKDRQTRHSKVQKTPSKRYWVVGQLRGIKKKKLLVLAGNARVRAEVDVSTRVEVDVEDLRFARPGDVVVVKGNYYVPGRANASSIDVTIVPPPKPKEKASRTREQQPQ